MAIEPTEEDVKRARKMCAWAAAGLEIFRHKLACEFKSVRDEVLDAQGQRFREALEHVFMCSEADSRTCEACSEIRHHFISRCGT